MMPERVPTAPSTIGSPDAAVAAPDPPAVRPAAVRPLVLEPPVPVADPAPPLPAVAPEASPAPVPPMSPPALPDDAAHRAAAAALDGVAADEVCVIDGLGVPAFAPLAGRLGGAVGLIHHPTQLEAGQDAAALGLF